MGRFVADKNQVAFIHESGTYANASGTGVWIGAIQEHSPEESYEKEAIRYQGSASRNVDMFVDTVIDLTGTLTYFGQNSKLLGYALGSIIDGSSGTTVTHTLVESNSCQGNAFTSGTSAPFMSFTLEDAHQCNPTGGNFVRTFRGCMVNSMTISASQGEIMNFEVEYLAQSVAFSSGAVTAITADTGRPFVWSDSQIHFGSGTRIDEVKDWELSINNNLEAPHYANGSRVVALPQPLNRDYELSLTIDSSTTWAKTLYDQYYTGGSEFNLFIPIINSAGNKEVCITLSGCKISSMESPSPIDGIDEQSLTITPKSCSAIAKDGILLYNPW